MVSEAVTPDSQSAEDGGPPAGQLVGLPVSEGVREVVLVLGWLCCVSGVMGNILIILTLLTQPSLRSLHNLFIGNLALADLAVVGYCLPFWLLDLLLGHYPVLGPTHCALNAFLLVLGHVASIFTLVLISFNRYLHVCRPSLYRQLFSRRGIIASCVLTWAVTAAEGLLPVFRVDGSSYRYSNKTHMCTFDGTTNPMNAFVLIAMINVVLSILLVGFFSLAIFRHWKQSKTRVTQWIQAPPGEPNKAPACLSQAEVLLIRSLVLVFLILILFCTPLVAGVAVMGIVDISPDVFCFLIFLFFFNNSINWVLYGALNKNFRKGYRQLVVATCCWSVSTR
ncbi:hypothetical protein ACOMHN_060457 [Nucella lapillus]